MPRTHAQELHLALRYITGNTYRYSFGYYARPWWRRLLDRGIRGQR